MKAKKIVSVIIFIIGLIGLCYSVVNIIIWKKDSDNTKKQEELIFEKIDVNEVEDNDDIEIVEQEEKIEESNPYWDYIKMNLIDVDISELKKINSNTVGWIQVGGTNINYPYVQASDNEYYLTHSFNKEKNQSGWAFMDYRNNKIDYDKNTIIYGHALLNGAIFGTLKDILSDKWKNNTDNHIIKISTEYENTLWQVFSVYNIKTTSDYLQIDFSDDEFLEFTNTLIKRSKHDFNTSVSKDDKILTLSSCYENDYNRIVLHAKLIKKSKKEF